MCGSTIGMHSHKGTMALQPQHPEWWTDAHSTTSVVPQRIQHGLVPAVHMTGQVRDLPVTGLHMFILQALAALPWHSLHCNRCDRLHRRICTPP